ncbi:PA14 domain-containing protein [Floridanema aerugineum]|uniref:PA14 domain-containing protein n=1 Tax=Floridaenema aerugineum BLCC-F46 TaxID=3153654 RepID=A0ABV4X6N3_9CYAN
MSGNSSLMLLCASPLGQESDSLKTNKSSVDELTGEVLLNSNHPILEQAIQSAQNNLKGLAKDTDFNAKMNRAFDNDWNAEVFSNLVQEFAKGNFSQLPAIEILPSAAINGANGAFASVTNTIYLAKEFVEQNAGNLDAITSVLLEETGHFIDSKINDSDAAGDEGDIFARVVQGQTISAGELLGLKGEDDTATVTLNQEAIGIEQSTSTISGNSTVVNNLDSSDGYNPLRSNSFYDDYRLTGVSAGQQVQLNMSSTAFDTYLQLVNESTGQVIQFDDDSGGGTNSRLSFTTQSGINYLVRATSYSANSTGSYSLSATSQSTSTPVNSIASLSINQTQSGQLSNTDLANPTRSGMFADDYRLTGVSAGQQVQLNMSSTAFDTYLQLVNESTGQVIQFDDDSGGGTNSRLSFTTQSGINYLVRATSYSANSTGSYSLSATAGQGQTQIPTNNWRAEYFNNIDLAGTPVFVENLGDGSQGFSRNWGNGSPNSNVPSDYFSARMTTQRYLAPGLYKITTQSDDGVRVRINNQTVVDRWVDQSFATNSGYFRSNGGTLPIAVEYYERGVNAAIKCDSFSQNREIGGRLAVSSNQ